MERRFFMEFDKAGAEWVVVAYLANDARMIDVVETGKSPHTITGSLISGAPPDLVERESKVVGMHTDPNTISDLRRQLPELQVGGYFLPRIMSIRQAGKKSNHGLNYDMRPRRFAMETELDERDAKRIYDAYLTVAYPGITVWWEGIRNQLRKDRTLTNCFGHKRRFLDQWGTELFQAAYSFLPQSTVVQMVNRGMSRIYADQSDLFRQFEILAQVHDSILTQHIVTPTFIEAARVAKKIDEYLSPVIQYSGREFNIKTDLKMGISWGHMHPVNLRLDVDSLSIEMQRVWDKINAKQEAA